MHETEIKEQEFKERKRHNKEEEELGERKSRRDFTSGMANAVARVLPKFANDPKFYTKYPELLAAVNSGALELENANYGGRINTAYGTGVGIQRVPLGTRINYWPTMGKLGPNSAADRASMIIWSAMTANIGYASSYTRHDILREQFAILNIYAFICELKRYYAMQKKCLAGSAYTKEHTAKLLGFDYVTTTADGLAQLKLLINSAIATVSQLQVFDELSLFSRMSVLNSDIFVDEDKMKRPQYYVFVPRGYYAMNSSGGLTVIPKANNYLQLVDIKTMLDTMLNGVIRNPWTTEINSNICRYLNKVGANLKTIEPLTESYEVKIVYDKYVLDQIQNATAMKVVQATKSLEIKYDSTIGLHYGPWPEDANNIPVTSSKRSNSWYVLFPTASQGERLLKYFMLDGAVVNSWFENPGVDYLMEATRLINSYAIVPTYHQDPAVHNTTISNVLCCDEFGTEILDCFDMYYYDYSTSVYKTLESTVYTTIDFETVPTSIPTVVHSSVPTVYRTCGVISKFHNVPRYTAFWDCTTTENPGTGILTIATSFDTASDTLVGYEYIWPCDYVRNFSRQWLVDANYAATMSVWKYEVKFSK